ncbi:MAG: TlyA family RNA methyltransferase [Alphaproteobacteria bacterium]|nr:TlyA family RNA methyltransferase [Alphaproteobacteria bacterium]
MTKVRLDQILVGLGLVESRAKAGALIMAGRVFVGGVRRDKPGVLLPDDAAIEVRGALHPWVGRGGVKLAHALDHFAIDPKGCRALDLGASTGGFTDVLLARGAARVHAVDVGHGQLAWKLRTDPRVVVVERTNARTLTSALVPDPPSLIVADLSFISLTVALPAALALAGPGATLIALVKPQFEVGRGRVGKGGIVRDPALHAEVCDRVRRFLEESGWTILDLIDSPITGADGNREFLIAARR